MSDAMDILDTMGSFDATEASSSLDSAFVFISNRSPAAVVRGDDTKTDEAAARYAYQLLLRKENLAKSRPMDSEIVISETLAADPEILGLIAADAQEESGIPSVTHVVSTHWRAQTGE